MELDLSDEEETNIFNHFWMEGDSLAPPCQADIDVIKCIVAMANPDEKSVLFDLGCGDGRICILASQITGCKSVGCEIEEKLFLKFLSKIDQSGICAKVTAVHGDLRDIDLSTASIITLYLLPESVEMIKNKLVAAIENGCILICNTWGPKGLKVAEKMYCGTYNSVTLLKYDRSSLLVD